MVNSMKPRGQELYTMELRQEVAWPYLATRCEAWCQLTVIPFLSVASECSLFSLPYTFLAEGEILRKSWRNGPPKFESFSATKSPDRHLVRGGLRSGVEMIDLLPLVTNHTLVHGL